MSEGVSGHSRTPRCSFPSDPKLSIQFLHKKSEKQLKNSKSAGTLKVPALFQIVAEDASLHSVSAASHTERVSRGSAAIFLKTLRLTGPILIFEFFVLFPTF